MNNNIDSKKRKADEMDLPDDKNVKLDFNQQIHIAVKKIKELKSIGAPQDEVRDAIKEFESFVRSEYQRDKNLLNELYQQINTAIQKIRELKAIFALQEEVMIAIREYIFLCDVRDIALGIKI
jgi:hypothetical protein